MNAEDICRHESGHLAMAAAPCVPVRRVWVDANGGGCEYLPVFSDDGAGAVARMLCCLGGLIESAPSGDDLPTWPIDPDFGPPEERHDRAVLANVAGAYGVTERQYRDIEIAAIRISLQRGYQRTVTAITGALSHIPVLDTSLIARVQAIAEGESR